MEDEATNPAEEAEVETPETSEAEEATDAELGIEESGEGDEPEDEEIEYAGAKYKVPKALAPIIAKAESLDGDYTRKTQTLAESRKAHEAERAQFQQETAINHQLLDDLSQLRAVERDLNEYQKTDWQRWYASNPQEAGAGQARFLQLQNAHRQIHGQVEGRKSEIAAIQEQNSAKLMSQAIESLSKPDLDKGWDGKFDDAKRGKLTSFGRELGYTDEELAGTSHPLMIKTLHLAQIGLEALKKSRAVTKQPSTPVIEAKPVPQLSKGKGQPIKGLDDRLSTEEWVKRRNEQERRLNAR